MNQETHGAVKLAKMEKEFDIRKGKLVIKAKGNANHECIGWILPGGMITNDHNYVIKVLDNLISRIKK